MKKLSDVKVGDRVTRMLANVLPMELTVTAITADRIICGGWEFDKKTGGEIDEDLGWDAHNTGSVLYVKD